MTQEEMNLILAILAGTNRTAKPKKASKPKKTVVKAHKPRKYSDEVKAKIQAATEAANPKDIKIVDYGENCFVMFNNGKTEGTRAYSDCLASLRAERKVWFNSRFRDGEQVKPGWAFSKKSFATIAEVKKALTPNKK